MVGLERAAAVDAAAGGGVHHAGDAGAVRHANGAAAAQQELAPRLAGEGLPGGEGHGGIGGGRGGRGAAGQLAPQLLLPLGDLLVNLPPQSAAALIQGLVHLFQHLGQKGVVEVAEGHQGIPLGARAAGRQSGEGGEHHGGQKKAGGGAECLFTHRYSLCTQMGRTGPRGAAAPRACVNCQD